MTLQSEFLTCDALCKLVNIIYLDVTNLVFPIYFLATSESKVLT